MDATTAVAIYAAIVATLAVFVQLAMWRSTRTQVRLRVNPGTGPVRGEPDGAGGLTAKTAPVVFIEITNRSGHPVKIGQMWAVPANDSKRGIAWLRPYPEHLTFPFEIPARDSRTIWILQEGFETQSAFRFGAKTTAGDEFKTKPIVLDDQPSLTYAELDRSG